MPRIRLRPTLSLVLSLSTSVGFACTCAPVSDEASFDRSKHVFVARITSVDDLSQFHSRGAEEPGFGVDDGLRISFEVAVRIKGRPQRLAFLYTLPGGSGGCGVDAVIGKHVLVATDNSGWFATCGLSRSFEIADCSDVDFLDRLRKRARNQRTPLTRLELDWRVDRGSWRVRELERQGRDQFSISPAECPLSTTLPAPAAAS